MQIVSFQKALINGMTTSSLHQSQHYRAKSHAIDKLRDSLLPYSSDEGTNDKESENQDLGALLAGDTNQKIVHQSFLEAPAELKKKNYQILIESTG